MSLTRSATPTLPHLPLPRPCSFLQLSMGGLQPLPVAHSSPPSTSHLVLCSIWVPWLVILRDSSHRCEHAKCKIWPLILDLHCFYLIDCVVKWLASSGDLWEIYKGAFGNLIYIFTAWQAGCSENGSREDCECSECLQLCHSKVRSSST